MLDSFLRNSLMKIAEGEQSNTANLGQNVQQAGNVQVNTQQAQQQAQQSQMASPQEMLNEALGMIMQGANIIQQIFSQIGMPMMMPPQGGIQVPENPPPQTMAQTPPQVMAQQAPALSIPQVQAPQQGQQNTI